MNWNQAEELLKDKIFKSLHLTPDAKFKIVKEVPPFQCKNYEYSEGFRVQVGAINEINIPLKMLKRIFEESIRNNGIYNRSVFKECCPRELNNKPCYVHSVGKLFEWSEVMVKINKNDYEVIF